jgi:TetR/AcrR family transcriptional repressor of nem operon
LAFDRDARLAAAMHAFWSGGFHRTSVPELTAATGLSTSSLYNTYGSKLDLFVAALDRYLVRIIEGHMLGPLRQGTGGLDDIEALLGRLDRAIEVRPARGCLAVNTISEFRDPPTVVGEREADYLRQLRVALGAALTRAEARGEIPVGVAEARTEALVPLVIAFNVLVASSAPASVARGVLEAARTIAAGA